MKRPRLGIPGSSQSPQPISHHPDKTIRSFHGVEVRELEKGLSPPLREGIRFTFLPFFFGLLPYVPKSGGRSEAFNFLLLWLRRLQLYPLLKTHRHTRSREQKVSLKFQGGRSMKQEARIGGLNKLQP